ncbi:hypothetical protein [Streptomyces sp. 3N207]
MSRSTEKSAQACRAEGFAVGQEFNGQGSTITEVDVALLAG